MLSLAGQTHVVLGAGQGIGRETARALAGAGARVVCVDLDPDRVRAVADDVGGVAVCRDVTAAGSIADVLRTTADDVAPLRGVIDIVGMTRWVALREADDESWTWQDTVVTRHALRVVREAVPVLVPLGGGSLTFVASVSALTSAPGHGLYGMAKAALTSMVRTAAVELGPHSIRVNSVSPGATRTPQLLGRREFDQALALNAERTPLRKLAEPADIAGALLFLSSGLAAHITGHDLVVDGGLSLFWPLASPSAGT